MRVHGWVVVVSAACQPGEIELDPIDPIDPIEEPDCELAYTDRDGDGAGDPASARRGCALEAGEVRNGDDCDDLDGAVYPGAPEICDERDQDCDAVVDEDAVDARAWYVDGDEDGYGSVKMAEGCSGPRKTVPVGGDCDDADPYRHPGMRERPCDGRDDNCDGNGTDRASQASSDGTDYPTVQAAIDGAALGAEVQVCARRVEASLVVSRDVRLSGYINPPPVILAPEGQPALSATADRVTLKNLVFSGGTSDSFGGAVVVYAGDLTVDGVVFEGGSAPKGGGGGLMWDAAYAPVQRLSLREVTFRNNRSDEGPGALAVVADGAAEVGLQGVTFEDNVSGGRGGALGFNFWNPSAGAAKVSIAGSSFRRNRAVEGGGVALLARGPVSVEVVESTWQDNEASVAGGGLFVLAEGRTTLGFEKSVLNQNVAPTGAAGHFGGAGEVEASWVDSDVHLNAGGPALVLAAEGSGLLSLQWGLVTENRAGVALVGPGPGYVVLDRVDLGTKYSDNQDYDVLAGKPVWFDGVTVAKCDRTGCWR